MSVLLAISLTTGVLSGLWGWLSVSLGLITWAGFLGCTSYFASPTEGPKGLFYSSISNLSGVFWATIIIKLSQYFAIEIISYVVIAFVVFAMCIQARLAFLSYIPGTFIGCCAMFASDGDWLVLCSSLVVGGVFGFLMKSSGLWLHEKVANNTANQEQPTP